MTTKLWFYIRALEFFMHLPVNMFKALIFMATTRLTYDLLWVYNILSSWASYLFNNLGNKYKPASYQTCIKYFTLTCLNYDVY